jgi:hypothetical protein
LSTNSAFFDRFWQLLRLFSEALKLPFLVAIGATKFTGLTAFGQKNNRLSYPCPATSETPGTIPCGCLAIPFVESFIRTEFLASIVIFARLILSN